MKTFSVAIFAVVLCASAVFADEKVQPGNYLVQFLTGVPFPNTEMPNIEKFQKTIECTIDTVNELISNTKHSEAFKKSEAGLKTAAVEIVGKCPTLEEDKIVECAWEQVEVATNSISKFVAYMVEEAIKSQTDANLISHITTTLKATCAGKY